MNASFKLPFGILVSAAAGFILAAVFVRWVKPADGYFEKFSGSEPAGFNVVPHEEQSMISLPESGAFQMMNDDEKLAFSAGVGDLTGLQRLTFLQECLSRSEPERTVLLALLLADWAEKEPAAACEWTLDNLEDKAADKCLHDVLHTWAAHDGMGLAQWYNLQSGTKKRQLPPTLRSHVWNSLEQHDPVSLASFCEMECNRGSVTSGFDFKQLLRTPESVKNMSQSLEGHVSYIGDPAELQMELSEGSSARHQDNKSGWNELFENTAVAWHRLNPVECDAWLSTWPENAQLAARHFIEQDQTKAGDSPATPAAGIPAPPNPAARSPETTASEINSWSKWWRRDPPAAEAFLNSAPWSETLKFKARSVAYSSAP